MQYRLHFFIQVRVLLAIVIAVFREQIVLKSEIISSTFFSTLENLMTNFSTTDPLHLTSLNSEVN